MAGWRGRSYQFEFPDEIMNLHFMWWKKWSAGEWILQTQGFLENPLYSEWIGRGRN